MSPDLQRLIELQQLETAIADARSRIASHPERVAEADRRLEQAASLVEGVKARLKENQDGRRELEKHAALHQGRLSKFKDQLAQVKTNREYQAIQIEIETAGRELGAAEEKVLERMMAADDIGTELKRAETEFAAARKAIEGEKRALVEELAATERDLAKAAVARDALVAAADPKLVALFHQVARARKGIAIATATRDGLCSVCHVRLRPPVFQKVRQNDAIVQCETCQRILYYVAPPRAEAQAASGS